MNRCVYCQVIRNVGVARFSATTTTELLVHCQIVCLSAVHLGFDMTQSERSYSPQIVETTWLSKIRRLIHLFIGWLAYLLRQHWSFFVWHVVDHLRMAHNSWLIFHWKWNMSHLYSVYPFARYWIFVISVRLEAGDFNLQCLLTIFFRTKQVINVKKVSLQIA